MHIVFFCFKFSTNLKKLQQQQGPSKGSMYLGIYILHVLHMHIILEKNQPT